MSNSKITGLLLFGLTTLPDDMKTSVHSIASICLVAFSARPHNKATNGLEAASHSYNEKPMPILIKFLCIAIALLAAFAGLLFIMQDRMILLPGLAAAAGLPRLGPGAAEWTEHDQYRGIVIEPPAPAQGTVVFFHGNATLAPQLQVLAPYFLDRGLRVVLQEYPGFDRRPGKPTVRSALTSAHEDVALAARKWPGPLYLAGHSFGAGLAAQVAGANPDKIAGILLFTPWNSLASLAREKYFGIPLDFLLHERLDSAEALKRYNGPSVIVAAEQDTIVPPHHAKALADAIPNAHYIALRGADHVSWIDAPMPGTYARIFEAWGSGPDR